MKNTFSKKPAYFESKSQIAPNALIYNKVLSDAAIRLLLALNAVPDSWVIVQSDIRERLAWGRDKMQNAIKECVKHGYMKVTQTKEKGKFSVNNFEFDTSPSYLKKPPHDEYEPLTENPLTVHPLTVKPPLPCKRPCTKLKIYDVIDTASRSMPQKKYQNKSMVKVDKYHLTTEQNSIYEWLISLNIPKTDHKTLTWWAKNYSMARIETTYKEAKKRKAKNIGAYMRKLLESDSVVSEGRIEQNACFARDYQEANNWRNLQIHQKYAYILHGNAKHEISFNMDPLDFAKYLMEKHKTFEGK